ncbi:MAG: hypothetical protein ACYCZX_15075 [Rhodospirillaceae bacterium]
MPAPLQHWTVLPHEPLRAVDDNILTVVGRIKMPMADFPRRMTVVRLRGGRAVIFSGIALDEEEMRELEDFGDPAFLIVPSDRHRLDAKIWRDRYPAIEVIAPEGAREKVAKLVHVDAVSVTFDDPKVRFVTVPGMNGHEAALEVDGPGGLTLVLNDIIGNIRDPHGFGGWLLRMMGFAGDGPHVPGPVKATIGKGTADLARQLRAWAAMPLKRIIVSHGETIDSNPQGALLALAATLD